MTLRINASHASPPRPAPSPEEDEALLRASFDDAPIGMALGSLDGRWMRVNHALSVMLGYSEAELLATNYLALTHPEDVDRSAQLHAAILAGELTQYHFEKRYLHRGGGTVWASVHVAMLRNGTDAPIRLIIQVQDITDRVAASDGMRELEEQLRHSQKMEAIGRLAGGVAHDFNNLLTVIQSYGTFIAEQISADSPVHADVDEILAAAKRGTALTGQLLAFSRRQMLQPRNVDVNLSVDSVVGMLRRLIGADITVKCDTPDVWPVLADQGQLEQVLMNLAFNARDAMVGGGVLSIRTANCTAVTEQATLRAIGPGDYVSIVVSDTGVGIPGGQLSQIFEPFFTTKAPGKGTGLGLATVYGIVRQSGGCVYAESEVGHGSRFTVLLPRAADSPPVTPVSD